MAGGIILTLPQNISTVHVHQNIQTNHSKKLAVWWCFIAPLWCG